MELIDKIKQYWQIGLMILVLVGLAWEFRGLRADASEAKQKTASVEETLVDIKLIAQSLVDPNDWLKNYFLTKGVDKETAQEWSTLPRKVRVGKDGNYSKLPFIDPTKCPELGIYQKYISNDTIKIIDTIWNFNKKDGLNNE